MADDKPPESLQSPEESKRPGKPTDDVRPETLEELGRVLGDPSFQEAISSKSPDEIFNDAFASSFPYERLYSFDLPGPEPVLPWYKRREERQKLGITVLTVFAAIAAGAACVLWPGVLTKIIFVLSTGAAVGIGLWFVLHLRQVRASGVYGVLGFIATALLLALFLLRPQSPAPSSGSSVSMPVERNAPVISPPTKFEGVILGYVPLRDKVRPNATVIVADLKVQNRGGPGRIAGWNASALTVDAHKVRGEILGPPAVPVTYRIPGMVGGTDLLVYSVNTEITFKAEGKTFATYDDVEGMMMIFFSVHVVWDTLKVGVEDQNERWSVVTKPTPQPLP